ncbi:hypothetical protein ACF0H5_008229 [Mactra antiquata]
MMYDIKVKKYFGQPKTTKKKESIAQPTKIDSSRQPHSLVLTSYAALTAMFTYIVYMLNCIIF